MATHVRRPAGMSITRPWNPASEFEDLQDRMGQLMQTMFDGDGGVWAPPVDIEEAEDAWILEAEVPGARRDDIDVQVRDKEVMITGEIKERERKGLLRRRTRRTGRFEYRVTLPGETDPSSVEANLNEGVLTLRIPKAERARPQHVEIKSS